MESQGGQIGVKCRIRHYSDDDIGIFLFYGSTKAKNLQGKIMTETRENLNALFDRIQIGYVVSSLVTDEKNCVSHSGKLISELYRHIFPATAGDSVKNNHYFHKSKSSKNECPRQYFIYFVYDYKEILARKIFSMVHSADL